MTFNEFLTYIHPIQDPRNGCRQSGCEACENEDAVGGNEDNKTKALMTLSNTRLVLMHNLISHSHLRQQNFDGPSDRFMNSQAKDVATKVGRVW